MAGKSAMVHPYKGHTVALATKHQKEEVLGPIFQSSLGLKIFVPPNLDTDLLGTFSGEIQRIGTPHEVAIKKARWGMRVSSLSLGLASEGSFGPDPRLMFVPSDHELLAFVDDNLGIEVIEQVIDLETNYGSQSAKTLDDLADFLVRAKFPSHGLIVEPNSGFQVGYLFKGITDPADLHKAIAACAAVSHDGLARVQTDMRAHMNPSRRAVLRQVAQKLVLRLATLCPQCATPGWGMVDSVKGLPCEWCHSETSLTRQEVYGCVKCDYRDVTPRNDGLQFAPASLCPSCNP